MNGAPFISAALLIIPDGGRQNRLQQSPRFIEDLHAGFSFTPQLALFFQRQRDFLLTSRTTTAFIFFRALRALYKEKMTPLITAVGVRIT